MYFTNKDLSLHHHTNKKHNLNLNIMFGKLKNLVQKQVDNSKGKYKLFLDVTYEMPKEFADAILENDIVSRQLVTDENGKEICLSTFRTVVFANNNRKLVMLKMFDLKASDGTKNYVMS